MKEDIIKIFKAELVEIEKERKSGYLILIADFNAHFNVAPQSAESVNQR